LYELSQFASVSGILSCKTHIESLSGSFLYTRRLYSDGNTFFRAFIFSMLEHFILTGDIEEIERFMKSFNDTLNINSVFKIHNETIDKEQIMHILYIIRCFIESKDLVTAHQVLFKVYMEYSNFDFVF
jgi:hypothetical protein